MLLDTFLGFMQRLFGPFTLQLFSASPTIVQLRAGSTRDVIEYRRLEAAPEPGAGEEHSKSGKGMGEVDSDRD